MPDAEIYSKCILFSGFRFKRKTAHSGGPQLIL